MSRFLRFIAIVVLLHVTLFAQKQCYLAINGTPKYKKDFKHFDYVDANAKKGGTFKWAVQGTFDSFNMFTLKGTPGAGIGLLYDTLMSGSLDENSISYPLLAESVELGPKNEWVRFFINKKAKFHDGKPVTAEDVKFSFDLLTTKGSPIYKRYYFDVKEAKVIDKYTVQFDFKRNSNKELAMILGQLSILPKHFWKDKDFLKSDSVMPVGSGAYKIKDFKFGKYIVYELDKNYWAKDLNVNIGQNNFGKIWYDYYKDKTVILEAFKAGNIDFVMENTAKNWATLYVGKNFDNGKIKKENISHELPQGMQGFIFNQRDPLFKDLHVRKALNLAFDFEWTNKKLFYNQYKRTTSYFDNCELKATGKPSMKELELLNPYRDILPKEVFEEAYKPNVTKGDGNIRGELKEALSILKKQGWSFNKNKLLAKNGKEFKFEILLSSPLFEKILNPFIQNLKKIGIKANIRVVDGVAYANKMKNFDFDMAVMTYGVSLSPGNELRNYWGSKSADIKGSRNYMGIRSKAVDGLIDKIVVASSREDLIVAVKALDRVLTHNYLLIPNYYLSSFRVAYWDKFNQPKISPKYGFGLFTWWIKKEFR